MNKLNLVFAPDPIYKMKSEEVKEVSQEITDLMDQMLEFVKAEHAYGIAAPMLGILKRIIIINMDDPPLFMVNPVIIYSSEAKDKMREASLSFLGIEVEIERPSKITVEFLNYQGQKESLEAENILARCIMHEIDYLNGINILDYVSKLKKDTLIRKMEKLKKYSYKPHVHSASCNH